MNGGISVLSSDGWNGIRSVDRVLDGSRAGGGALSDADADAVLLVVVTVAAAREAGEAVAASDG